MLRQEDGECDTRDWVGLQGGMCEGRVVDFVFRGVEENEVSIGHGLILRSVD
jgi:hypothetical protein